MFAAGLAVVGCRTGRERLYTVGWEHSPPGQIAQGDGEPTGFAVEMLREAARRRGIRIRWQRHDGRTE